MKFAICNEPFHGWVIEDVFRAASELGYDGVEIAPFTLADSVDYIHHAMREEIVKAAIRHNVEVVGLHWLLSKPEGLYINHPDEEVRLRTRKYLNSLIRFCSDIGGQVLVFGSPKQRSVHPELTYEQAWEYARETFAHCAETARHCGVYLCIEPLSTNETDFINNITEAVRMVREVDKPHLRTMVDVKAMCSEGRPFADIVQEAGDLIMHVHANDESGKGPGAGETDFREVKAALDKIGYDGYVSVEVFDFRPDPLIIARESLAHLKEIFGE